MAIDAENQNEADALGREASDVERIVMHAGITEKFVNIVWDSGLKRLPRCGFFGKIIDKIKPRYIIVRKPRFVTIGADGGVLYSSDGIVWSENA